MAQDVTTLTIKTETKGVPKATDQLNKLEKQGVKTENTSRKVTNAIGGIGRKAGQAGIQVQQFVGQVQMGTSPMVALSQQATDLGFVLGFPLAGAVAGIGASLISTLVPNLFKSEEAVGSFTEELIKTVGGIEKLTDAQRALVQLDTERKINDQRQAVIESQKAYDELAIKLDRVTEKSKGRGRTARAAKVSVISLNEAESDLAQELAMVSAELEVSNEFLDKLKSGTEGANTVVSDMIDLLKFQSDTLGKSAYQIDLYTAKNNGATESELSKIKAIHGVISAHEEKIEIEKKSLELARSIESQRKQEEKTALSMIDRFRIQSITMDEGRASAIRYTAQIQAAKIANKELASELIIAAEKHAQSIEAQESESNAAKKATEDLKVLNEQKRINAQRTEEMKRQSDDWAKTFADNMVDAGGSFSNFADGVIKQMQKIAIQKATQPLFSAFSGFLDSSAFSSLLSFEGGGSTGGGSRSGGVDGKGGFPAIVHPNETVIDHTKGQSGSISVVVNVDASGSRTETNGGGADLGKAIGDAVKSILIQEKRAGGLLT